MRLAIIASALSILITSAMDIAGYTNFSAFPLLFIMLFFWFIQKNSMSDIGFNIGTKKSYVIAFFHPLIVSSLLFALAYLSGDTSFAEADIEKTLILVSQIALGTFLMTIITEEGFFRGWLWASLNKTGMNYRSIIIVTSIIFMLWHVSFATLAVGYELPFKELPIYLINVFLLGISWGIIRQISNSIIVAALTHGLWNGVVYGLFGLAKREGALGIQELHIYGPETGYLGLTINLFVTFLLWKYVMRTK